MGSDRPRRGDEFFAGQTERIRRELRDSGIPVFALSDATKPKLTKYHQKRSA